MPPDARPGGRRIDDVFHQKEIGARQCALAMHGGDEEACERQVLSSAVTSMISRASVRDHPCVTTRRSRTSAATRIWLGKCDASGRASRVFERPRADDDPVGALIQQALDRVGSRTPPPT